MSKLKVMQMTIFEVPQYNENKNSRKLGQSNELAGGIDFYKLYYPSQDVSRKTISQIRGLEIRMEYEILALMKMESWGKTLCRN